MAFIPINLDGQMGLIRDIPGHLLRPNTWTDAQNVRMDNRVAGAMLGHIERYATPTIAPYKVFFIPGESNLFWVLVGLTDVIVHDASSYTEITRVSGDYTGGESDRWNGGVLSGILILNNGVDDPQYWATAAAGTKLADLPNWPANTKAKVVRPFLNFLIALDVTESGTRQPYLVKWSHGADAGAVPTSWDDADASLDAGEFDLGQTKDFLVDCLPLGENVNIVYKEHTAWVQQFSGHPFIFSFRQIPGMPGMFAQQCAVEISKGRHAVLTRGDFIVHNGQTFESVIDGRNREWLFDSIDSDNWDHTFVAHILRYNEVWICFPSAGSTSCDMALVWNYRENTYGVRDLPDVRDIGLGVINPAADDTWDAGPSTTWDGGAAKSWDTVSSDPTRYLALMASPDNTKVYEANNGYDFDGTAFTTYLEREGLAVESIRRDNSITINTESWKFLRGIRPRFQALPSGGSIDVWVGTQDHVNEDSVWSGPYTTDADVNFKVDVTKSARLFGVRFQSTDHFEIDGYDLDIEPTGLW